VLTPFSFDLPRNHAIDAQTSQRSRILIMMPVMQLLEMQSIGASASDKWARFAEDSFGSEQSKAKNIDSSHKLQLDGIWDEHSVL
jgi:hypothetical protein